MDAWGVPPSSAGDSNRSMNASTGAGFRPAAPVVGDKQVEGKPRGLYKQHGGSPPSAQSPGEAEGGERPTRHGFLETEAAVTECLVVSGALDRTLCVFRARFGQGLCLLRRLNVACSPRGLPGALIVGVPVEGANWDIDGKQLEVCVICPRVVRVRLFWKFSCVRRWLQVRLCGNGILFEAHARLRCLFCCAAHVWTTLHGAVIPQSAGEQIATKQGGA